MEPTRTWTRPALRDFLPPAPPLGMPGDPGLFGPGTAAWRLGRERLLMAGGPAALLLQLAHPLVAAGVDEHSDFAPDPLRRLRATLHATLLVTFGDRAQVQAAADAVARRHRPVRGRLSADTGPFPAGTAYRADDPDLARWVLATLVWTAVTVIETFLGPLPAAERDAYYRDMQRFGRLFSADPERLPADYAALEEYVQDAARQVLAVGPVAHRLARQILTPEPPVLALPLRPLLPLLAGALLPAAVRDAYALPWRRRERVLFAAVRETVRRGTPVLPAAVRYWPHYCTAVQRLESAGPGARLPAQPGR